MKKKKCEGCGQIKGDVLKYINPYNRTNKIIYINFLHEIQPECDCMPLADVPIVQDQGILISTDPVAIDKASVDIINSAEPILESVAGERGAKKGDDILYAANPASNTLQIEYSEKCGMGSMDYEIVEWEEVD